MYYANWIYKTRLDSRTVIGLFNKQVGLATLDFRTKLCQFFKRYICYAHTTYIWKKYLQYCSDYRAQISASTDCLFSFVKSNDNKY